MIKKIYKSIVNCNTLCLQKLIKNKKSYFKLNNKFLNSNYVNNKATYSEKRNVVDFCCLKGVESRYLNEIFENKKMHCPICSKIYEKEKVFFSGKIFDNKISDEEKYVDMFEHYKQKEMTFGEKFNSCYPRLLVDKKDKSQLLNSEYHKSNSKNHTSIINPKYIISGPITVINQKKWSEIYENKQQCLDECYKMIKESDFVIAKINKEMDCHGSFLEIGYAIGLKKTSIFNI